MQTISEYNKLAVPDYALPYLVNADNSGINDSETQTIDAWMQRFYDEAKQVGGHVIFSAGDGEGSFTHRPEFGLACNCVDCTILIVK